MMTAPDPNDGAPSQPVPHKATPPEVVQAERPGEERSHASASAKLNDRPGSGTDNGGKRQPLPKLIVFLAIHTGIGIAMGVIFASLLVQFNVSGLRDLLLISDSPYLPMFMLYWMMALTFAMFNVAAAVFLLPFDRSGH